MEIQPPVLIITYVASYFLALLSNVLVLVSQYMLRNDASAYNIYMTFLGFSNLVIPSLLLEASIRDLLLPYTDFSLYRCFVVPYLKLFCVSSTIFCTVAIAVDLYRAVKKLNAASVRRRWSFQSVGVVFGSAAFYSLRVLLQLFIPDGQPEVEYQQDLLESAVSAADEEAAEVLVGTGTMTYVFSTHDLNHIYTLDQHTENTSASKSTVGMTTTPSAELDRGFCDLYRNTALADVFYRLTDFFVLFVCPVLAHSVLYGSIAARLWKSNVTMGSVFATHRYRQLVKMSLAVLVCFFLCWGPSHVSGIVQALVQVAWGSSRRLDIDGSVAGQVTSVVAFCSTWLIPVTYAQFNTKIRRQVMVILTLRKENRVSPNESTQQTVNVAQRYNLYTTNALNASCTI